MSKKHSLVIVALLLSVTSLASAERTPAQLRTQLTKGAKKARMKSYVRKMPNGAKRVYFDPSNSQELRAVEMVLHQKGNTLEILHSGAPNANHTLGLYNRNLLHAQSWTGSGNWRLRAWGQRLRPSSQKLYSAVIQLTDGEAQRLTERLQQGAKAQGAEPQAGANWERGNLRMATNRSINCVSYWSEMPIGEGGAPLWKVLGLHSSYTGNPRGLLRALETEGNEKVAGICAYGPKVAGFGADVNRNLFSF
ncbi:MAG: hypothetical protein JRH20_27560 [Deltaproteobacteria bacterium]|nr:hypothetical protein [Deltaproteobacteria bacterium]